MYRGNINRCYVFNISVVCGNKENANIYSGDRVEWLLWKQTHSWGLFYFFFALKDLPDHFPLHPFFLKNIPFLSHLLCLFLFLSLPVILTIHFHFVQLPSILFGGGGEDGGPTCSSLMKLSSFSFNRPTLRHPETAPLSLPAVNVCFPNKCRAECWGRWHPPTRGANAPDGAALTSTGIKYMRHY